MNATQQVSGMRRLDATTRETQQQVDRSATSISGSSDSSMLSEPSKKALYAIDEIHCSFMTRRDDVDRHIALSRMIGPDALRAPGGAVHGRHIIPVKWFVHSFNKIMTRIHARPELFSALQTSLISRFPRTAQKFVIVDGNRVEVVRELFINVLREALNQRYNLFIGPANTNMINGRLISLLSKPLLRAHDAVNETIEDLSLSKLSRKERTALADKIENIVFHKADQGKRKDGELHKTGFPLQIWSQSGGENYTHLRPVLQAIHSHIADLRSPTSNAEHCVDSVKDLLFATVDSVCVDLSMTGERSVHYEAEYQAFRKAQHDLLLPLGQKMMMSVAVLCHAFEQGNIALVSHHVAEYIAILEKFCRIDDALAKEWILPRYAPELGSLMLGTFPLRRATPVAESLSSHDLWQRLIAALRTFTG